MARTLRDALLPAIDAVRGIPGVLGFRLYSVAVVQRAWTGSRAGIGNYSDATTGVRVDVGTFQVKVRALTTKEIVESAGLFTDQDLEIGPITPPFTGSAKDNDAISVFDPSPGGTPTELMFRIIGPGYPGTGAWFKKVSQRVDRPLRYTFIVRKTGQQP